MMTFKLTPNTPQTFSISPDENREAVSSAFYKAAEAAGGLTPKRLKKIEPLTARLFDALDLTGRLLFLTDTSKVGSLAPPDGDPLLLFLIFVRDREDLRGALTKMFDLYYYDLFSSAFISEGIRRAKDALKEAALSAGYDLPDPLIPGLESCPLKAQREIFRLLEPEDLGVRLLSSDLMEPINSYTCLYRPKALPAAGPVTEIITEKEQSG